jgi:hypothetical protein
MYRAYQLSSSSEAFYIQVNPDSCIAIKCQTHATRWDANKKVDISDIISTAEAKLTRRFSVSMIFSNIYITLLT